MEQEGPRIMTFGPGVPGIPEPGWFGAKAAHLARMAAIGIPVPPGFALNVSICEQYFSSGKVIPPDMPGLLHEGIRFLEEVTGCQFGSRKRPLLVSVRSGAATSMPGMMETVLNVGLSRETLRGFIVMYGNPRLAWNSYCRLIEQFGTVVHSHDAASYHDAWENACISAGAEDIRDLDAMALSGLAETLERIYRVKTGDTFPADPQEQIIMATETVLASWNAPRAVAYRGVAPLSGMKGTAVTVQAMVFGNAGPRSGSGVLFTRDPSDGAPYPVIDFVYGGQGEDVVSGRATASFLPLSEAMSGSAEELDQIGRRLETVFHDMQDIEFTIQEGRLFILQARAGKRAPLAALRIAVDLCREGIITSDDALLHLRDIDLDTVFENLVSSPGDPLYTGIPASSGIASGRAVFSSEEAVRASWDGPVILIRETASPDDMAGIIASGGILTREGSRTSHAAVVARHLGKACVIGCRDLIIDDNGSGCSIARTRIASGDLISLDGTTGAVYLGEVDVRKERPEGLVAVVREWQKGL
jgi:pyruvate,orthophosphate dikinase